MFIHYGQITFLRTTKAKCIHFTNGTTAMCFEFLMSSSHLNQTFALKKKLFHCTDCIILFAWYILPHNLSITMTTEHTYQRCHTKPYNTVDIKTIHHHLIYKENVWLRRRLYLYHCIIDRNLLSNMLFPSINSQARCTEAKLKLKQSFQ